MPFKSHNTQFQTNYTSFRSREMPISHSLTWVSQRLEMPMSQPLRWVCEQV